MNSIQQVLLSVSAEKGKWKNEVLIATDQIHSVDLQELSDWFSEDISNTAFRFDTTNLLFHPLPSGNYTLGRIIPQPGELFSSLDLSDLRLQRKQSRCQAFHVHYFIFSQETLLRCANNPIAVYQQIYAHRKLSFFRKRPQALAPIYLSPEKNAPTPLIHEHVLDSVAVNPGAKVLATLLQTIFDSVSTFFTGGPPTIRLIYSLFNLLPLSWRPELTFSTEFNFSRLRPFKVIGVSSGLELFRMNSGDKNISFCDLAAIKRSEQKSITLLDSWPLLIFHALLKKDYELLNRVYLKAAEHELQFRSEDSPPGTDPNELRLLANHFLKEQFQQREHSPQLLLPSFDEQSSTQQQLTTDEFSANCSQNDCERDEKPEDLLKNHIDNNFSAEMLREDAKEKNHLTIEETVFFTDDFFHSVDEEDPFKTSSSFVSMSTSDSFSGHTEYLISELFPPLTMLKVVQFEDSTSSSLGQRLRKFPMIQRQLKCLDACTARILLGDFSSVERFRNCWNEICRQINPLQKLELTEEYLLIVRDFINIPNNRSGQNLLQRDVNILELLDSLLT